MQCREHLKPFCTVASTLVSHADWLYRCSKTGKVQLLQPRSIKCQDLSCDNVKSFVTRSARNCRAMSLDADAQCDEARQSVRLHFLIHVDHYVIMSRDKWLSRSVTASSPVASGEMKKKKKTSPHSPPLTGSRGGSLVKQNNAAISRKHPTADLKGFRVHVGAL